MAMLMADLTESAKVSAQEIIRTPEHLSIRRIILGSPLFHKVINQVLHTENGVFNLINAIFSSATAIYLMNSA